MYIHIYTCLFIYTSLKGPNDAHTGYEGFIYWDSRFVCLCAPLKRQDFAYLSTTTSALKVEPAVRHKSLLILESTKQAVHWSHNMPCYVRPHGHCVVAGFSSRQWSASVTGTQRPSAEPRLIEVMAGRNIPKGPCTACLRTLVPKTIPGMAFGTRVLKWAVCGPSGHPYVSYMGALERAGEATCRPS